MAGVLPTSYKLPAKEAIAEHLNSCPSSLFGNEDLQRQIVAKTAELFASKTMHERGMQQAAATMLKDLIDTQPGPTLEVMSVNIAKALKGCVDIKKPAKKESAENNDKKEASSEKSDDTSSPSEVSRSVSEEGITMYVPPES